MRSKRIVEFGDRFGAFRRWSSGKIPEKDVDFTLQSQILRQNV